MKNEKRAHQKDMETTETEDTFHGNHSTQKERGTDACNRKGLRKSVLWTQEGCETRIYGALGEADPRYTQRKPLLIRGPQGKRRLTEAERGEPWQGAQEGLRSSPHPVPAVTSSLQSCSCWRIHSAQQRCQQK